MRLRPALLLAAPLGVLGGHGIGYLAAPGPVGAGAVHHGYLALALAVAVPLAVMATAWAAADGASGRPRTVDGRHRPAGSAHRGPVPVGLLLSAQWLLFTAQEALEHALAGHGPAAALQSRALWWGLGAQVATGLAVLVLLRASAAAGARLVTLSGLPVPVVLPRSPWRPVSRPTPQSSSPPGLRSARGPPVLRFA